MLVDRVELWHNISMSLGGKLESKLHDNFIVFKLIISAIPYANSIQPDYPKTKSVKTIVKLVRLCNDPRFFPNGETSCSISFNAILSIWESLSLRFSNLANLDNAVCKEENLSE